MNDLRGLRDVGFVMRSDQSARSRMVAQIPLSDIAIGLPRRIHLQLGEAGTLMRTGLSRR